MTKIEKPLRIHLIAICGTGMGALAVMLKSQGHEVTGSDENVYPPMSTVLEEQGIQVFQGFDAAHLEPIPDLVVIGNAISRGNVEAEAVLAKKIRYQSMPETLKEFFLWDKQSIVITGTHGKTTLTTMLAWVLEEAGLDPSYIIGGIPIGWETGAKLGQGPCFILEGDEYDSAFFDKRAKFLNYLPDIVVINNIEFDHADIYNSLDEITLAFKRLINIIPSNGLIIASHDDENIKPLLPYAFSPVETYGLSMGACWRVKNMEVTPSGTSFNMEGPNGMGGEVKIPLLGGHNVHNALAVIAAASYLGLSWDEIAKGLNTFPGIKRRLEVLGVVDGVTVYDDFAHHPTAVSVTLNALRAAHPNDTIWAVYEPRTATTIRRVFQKAYEHAFNAADYIIFAPVFRPEKAPETDRFSLDELLEGIQQAGGDAKALPDVETIVSYLTEHVSAGDHVLFMSNGGFGGIHGKMLSALNSRVKKG